MEFYYFDAFAACWLVAGTAGMKKIQAGKICRPRLSGVLSIASGVAGVVPLIVIKVFGPAHSAVGVVVAGVTLFWFAILGARFHAAT